MLRGTVEQQAGEGHIQGQASRCSGLAQQGGCNAGPGRQTKWDLGSRMLFEGAEKGSQEVKGQGLQPSPSELHLPSSEPWGSRDCQLKSSWRLEREVKSSDFV